MKVIISGGGTGGHISPALSIVEKLECKDEILYVGTKNSLESERAQKSNIPFKAISVEGFNRRNKLKNIKVIFKLLIGLLQSIGIILKYNPEVVIGTGGYVSGPIVFIGSLLGKKTYIHEQNAFPGITNRLLGKVVDKVFISYEDKAGKFPPQKTVLTGNPVGEAFLNQEQLVDSQRKTILSVGGSGGAEKINALALELIKAYNGKKNIEIIHITGKRYFEEFIKRIEFELEENISVIDYSNAMAEIVKRSDVVISRAGAITLAELKATRTPSILIPSPNVTDDHQTYNALAMEKLGVAKVFSEDTLKVDEVISIIDNDIIIDKMKSNFPEEKPEDAAQIIMDEIRKDL